MDKGFPDRLSGSPCVNPAYSHPSGNLGVFPSLSLVMYVLSPPLCSCPLALAGGHARGSLLEGRHAGQGHHPATPLGHPE